jgi:hypothetical protein
MFFILLCALAYAAAVTGAEKVITYVMTSCDGKTCKIRKERYQTLKECEDAKALEQLCTAEELKCIKY